jgi:hypothetical protein
MELAGEEEDFSPGSIGRGSGRGPLVKANPRAQASISQAPLIYVVVENLHYRDR